MVKTYDELRDENGITYKGRTRLFVRHSEINSEGGFGEFESGNAAVFDASGYQFIVDDYVISQINKLKIVDGSLVVRDGEEIIPPTKTEKELKIEEIERQLAVLKAELGEPVDIEEQADAPLLDYTEESSE